MADNILRVGTEFDVGPLVAGAKAAGVSLDEVGSRAKAASVTMADVGTKMGDASKATLELLYPTEAVGGALQDSTKASQAQNAAQTETISTSNELALAIAALSAEINKLAIAKQNAGRAAGGMTSAMGAARVEMGLVEGSAGMMASGLARVAAQSSALAPIITAAFPIVAVLAMVDIVGTLATKIAEAADAIAGWDKATQTAYKNAVEANMRLLSTNLEQSSQQQKQNQIGLEGMGKQREALIDLQADTQRYNQTAMDEERAVRGITEQIKELKAQRLEAAIDPSKFDYATLGKDIEEANRQLTNHLKMRDELTAKIRGLAVETAGAQKEIAAEGQRDAAALQSAQIAAAKAVADAQVSQQVELNRQLLANHEITIEEDRDRSLKAEEDKYNAEVANIEKRKALAESTAKRTGKTAAPELATLGADEEKLEIEHQTRISQIRANADQEIKKRDQERTVIAIENNQREVESADKVGDAYARRAFSKADSKAEVTSTELDLETRIAKTYEDQIKALNLKAAALSQADRVGNANAVATLNAEAIALDADKNSAIAAAKFDSAEKIKTLDRQELDDQLTATNKVISLSEEKSRAEVENDKRSFELRRVTLSQYTAEVVAAASNEYTTKAANYAKEIALINAAAQAEIITEEQKQKKLDAIWAEEDKAYAKMVADQKKATDEAALAMQKYVTTVTNELNKGLQLWMTQHITFAQAMMQVWRQVAEGAIMNLAKLAEQEALALIEHKALLQQQIIMDAKAAAAGAFHWVMATVPFPADLILAPVAAAAAFAGVMAFGAFEKGGIVPETGMAMVHAQEMVLPANISRPLQAAIPSIQNFNMAMQRDSGSGGATAGHTTNVTRGDTHVTINHQGTQLSHADIVKAVSVAMRRGELRSIP